MHVLANWIAKLVQFLYCSIIYHADCNSGPLYFKWTFLCCLVDLLCSLVDLFVQSSGPFCTFWWTFLVDLSLTGGGGSSEPREPPLATALHKCECKYNFACVFSPLAMVMNIMVLLLSSISVRVSWDRLDIPEITGYMVYYSQTGNFEMVTIETSITVTGSVETFVVIDNLRSGVEYQFQVVAVAELDGDVVMGERSAMSMQQIIIPTPATENSECECTYIYNYFLCMGGNFCQSSH